MPGCKAAVLLVLSALLTLSVLAGCGGGTRGNEDRQSSDTPPENVLTVLAGSELKDIEPLLPQIEQQTGVRLQLNYIGTLDGAEKLIAGEPTDLAWFSHAKYLALLEGSRILLQEKTMLSPVVLGVKESKAQEWGWIDNDELTWEDIADKAASGDLRYAMTNPASSNSGFTALVGVASALSGSGDVLQTEDINVEALQRFFTGQELTAGSSGWLAESYVREQDNLNGIINYESVLLQLNESGQLEEPLYLVYPSEGIITADYPVMLINEAKREAYHRLVDYLRTPEMQRTLMETTLRRPVIPEVALNDRFPDRVLVELPFPNDVEVIDNLIFSFLDEQRVPSHAFFVLDTSGSMEGNRIEDLKAALTNLTGMDQSLTGRFNRFRQRERLTFIPFDSSVSPPTTFEITDPESESENMIEIRRYISFLEADGGTAIYSALRQAYTLAAEMQAEEPDRYYSIVLMSDGENTEGIKPPEFIMFYDTLPEEARTIKTFTILFGDANVSAMESLANQTGGRMFDAKSASLTFIFKEIRGYQ